MIFSIVVICANSTVHNQSACKDSSLFVVFIFEKMQTYHDVHKNIFTIQISICTTP